MCKIMINALIDQPHMKAEETCPQMKRCYLSSIGHTRKCFHMHTLLQPWLPGGDGKWLLEEHFQYGETLTLIAIKTMFTGIKYHFMKSIHPGCTAVKNIWWKGLQWKDNACKQCVLFLERRALSSQTLGRGSTVMPHFKWQKNQFNHIKCMSSKLCCNFTMKCTEFVGYSMWWEIMHLNRK